MKNYQKGIVPLLVILVVVGITAVVVVTVGYSFLARKGISMSGESSGMNALRESFDLCRNSVIAADLSLLKKCVSSKSVAVISSKSYKMNPIKNLVIKSIDRVGSNNILITADTTYSNGRVETGLPMLFVMENGVWKFGVLETADYIQNNPRPVVKPADGSGYVDLAVTDIRVYPNPPKVNNPDTEIEVSIKNLGTESSTGTIEVEPEVVPLKGATEGSGVLMKQVDPGQTVTYVIKPYENSLSDIAGKKAIKFSINYRKTIPEKDYTNNTLSKEFDFVVQ